MVDDSRPPRRVRVEGDYFHGRLPAGAIYVGRGAPGLRGSKFANPFPLNRWVPRAHPLRRHLDAACLACGMTPAGLAGRDLLRPADARTATTAFHYWLREQPDLIADAEKELLGADLACWCPKPDGGPDWCHAVPLLIRVNGYAVAVPRQHFPAEEW